MREDQPPKRLVELGAEASPDEARAAQLLSSVRAPRPLTEQALVRGEARLGERDTQRIASKSSIRRWSALGALFGAPLAFAMALEVRQQWVEHRRAVEQEERIHTAAVARARKRAAAPPAPVPTPEAPPPVTELPVTTVEVEPPAPPARPERVPQRRGKTAGVVSPAPLLEPEDLNASDTPAIPERRAAPATAEAAPPPPPAEPAPEAKGSTLLAESGILSEALRELQAPDGAPAALATLRRYRRDYPGGFFLPEARAAEVEATLKAGNRERAVVLLADLARAGFSQVARPQEMRVLYGELLSQREQCGLAVPHFTRALEMGAAGRLAERARYGRASCRATLGEFDGAKEDLEAYLKQFPSGEFAPAARKALTR